MVAVVVLKAWVGRAGPALRHGHVATGYFPSGHTTSAFLCHSLVIVLARGVGISGWYPPAFRVGSGAAALVGTAMVYSNFHWLSDVLAGWALGAGLLVTTVGVAQHLLGSAAPGQQGSGLTASGCHAC